MKNISHENSTDEELVMLYRTDNNEQALLTVIKRYKPLAKQRAAFYCGNKNETDDFFQEALLGIYFAVLSFVPNRSAFSTFARLCIDRRLLSLLRSKYKSGKVPSELTVEYDDSVNTYGGENNPENLLADADGYNLLLDRLAEILSPFELAVLPHLLDGMSYRETANLLNVSVKSVDNAVQRIRRKIKK